MRRRDFLGAAAAAAAAVSAHAAAPVTIPVDPPKTPLPKDADILIVGSGAAGLSAALAALEAGAPSVTVIEKGPHAGGRTLFADGRFAAVHEGRQGVLGIVDSPEAFVRDIVAEGITSNPALARIVAGGSGAMLDHLEALGLRWRREIVEFTGGYARRGFSTSAERGGFALVEVLLSKLQTYGTRFAMRLRTPATALVRSTRDAGAPVTGVVTPEGTIRARVVILATGGRAKPARHVGPTAGMLANFNAAELNWDGADGDGIRMGEAVGAALVDADAVLLTPGTGANVTLTAGSALWLNAEGRRFVDECAGWRALNEALADPKSATPNCIFWVLFEAGRVTRPGTGAKIRAGLLQTADTLEEVSVAMGIPSGRIPETVAEWNALCAKEGETSSEEPRERTRGRRVPILTPPFCFGRDTPGIQGTLGGIVVDQETRVRDVAGAPIPGLFAAGETTGGVFGRSAVAGVGLTSAVVMGRIAGAAAWRSIEREVTEATWSV